MIKYIFVLGMVSSIISLHAQRAVVNVAVTNLRITPTIVDPALTAPALSVDMGSRETGQISQCLLNEQVEINAQESAPSGWTHVTALEQETAFREPIPQGFIRSEHLTLIKQAPVNTLIVNDTVITPDNRTIPLGTYLPGTVHPEKPNSWLVTLPDTSTATIPYTNAYSLQELGSWTEQQLRDAVITTAYKFLTTMFVWGGRSIALPSYTDTISGVDNSGLIHLIFRTININLPRNTKHILVRGLEYSVKNGTELQPGDVVFFIRPNLITNVALYLGNDTIMFATGNPTGQDFSSKHEYSPDIQKKLSVQTASLSDFFSDALTSLKNGDQPHWHDCTRYPRGTKIYFSSFITNQS